jgi:hypothetical protein
MIHEEQGNGPTNIDLFKPGDLDLSHSVLAKFLCDMPQLRSFVREHVVKGLHRSYTQLSHAIRGKMYAVSNGESGHHRLRFEK